MTASVLFSNETEIWLEPLASVRDGELAAGELVAIQQEADGVGSGRAEGHRDVSRDHGAVLTSDSAWFGPDVPIRELADHTAIGIDDLHVHDGAVADIFRIDQQREVVAEGDVSREPADVRGVTDVAHRGGHAAGGRDHLSAEQRGHASHRAHGSTDGAA